MSRNSMIGQAKRTAARRAGGKRARIEPLEPRLLMAATLIETAATFVFAPSAIATSGRPPLRRARPSRALQALPSDLLAPPVLPGTSQTVQLAIGDATGKSAQPLGVNIGSGTSYAEGNVINEMITQGGGFEEGNGEILVHAVSGSTLTQLVVDSAWLWNSPGQIGYQAAVGQMLVGSTGANQGAAFRITAMQDQLDTQGHATGNALITIAGNFAVAPVAADSFFVEILGDGDGSLSDNTTTSGNATVTRDTTVAHSGSASALFNFGAPASGTSSGTLTYYFGVDATAGRNILQPGHTYQFSFWAMTTTASTAALSLQQGRNAGGSTVTLIPDGQWHQYRLQVDATQPVVIENGQATLTIQAGTFGAVHVDDVHLIDLTDQIAPGNPLSKEVVSLIQSYGFSNLRFWEPELRFARLDDLIGDPASRPMIQTPSGAYDPQLGLPEMLELARETGTSAWLVIPTTWTATDMHNLMQYLGGAADTPYGAKRVADGHPGSWFDDLKGIYLEAGNESWNGTFAPNAYVPFEPYFARAEDMFHAVKTDPLYAANAAKLQLIVNGWQWVPWYTQQAVLDTPDADAVDVSAYTTGPNAQMPMDQLLGGVLSQQLGADSADYPATIFGKKDYVYEEAAGELQGSLTAAQESTYATSLGAGLAVIRNAMDLSRDDGMSLQNLFTLFQHGNNLPSGYTLGHYGIFSDLSTAETNPRPIALAAQLLDHAQGTILATTLSPGWVVDSTSPIPEATTTQAADAMVTTDGTHLVVTLFNNTVAGTQNTLFHLMLPATVNGVAVSVDWAHAVYQMLTGPAVDATNESQDDVTLGAGQYTHLGNEVYLALPGHSMGSFVIPLIPPAS